MLIFEFFHQGFKGNKRPPVNFDKTAEFQPFVDINKKFSDRPYCLNILYQRFLFEPNKKCCMFNDPSVNVALQTYPI